MEKICLLGASGSVGETTLKVLRQFKNDFSLHSFSVHSSIEKAKSIIEEFHPKYCIVSGEGNFGEKYLATEILYGKESLSEIVKNSEVDIVVTAVVGSIGVMPTIEAIKSNKKIAIANKETLVTFGPIIKKLLETSKSILVPVDSEHNALFQLLEGFKKEQISKIILTASGGSFRDFPIEKLKSVTVAEALNHPTWKMGKKITVDSAGLVNKGLEVIEAHFLFGYSYDQIDIVIHPESIVHGLIELNDGATIAYASKPDMSFPVAHSLFYPRIVPELIYEYPAKSWKNLNFREVDVARYPAIKLAYAVGKQGGTAPAIFNAANEEAVQKFLDEKISFLEIPILIEKALNKIEVKYIDDILTFLDADLQARKFVQGI